jgi:hypothetical protein
MTKRLRPNKPTSSSNRNRIGEALLLLEPALLRYVKLLLTSITLTRS